MCPSPPPRSREVRLRHGRLRGPNRSRPETSCICIAALHDRAPLLSRRSWLAANCPRPRFPEQARLHSTCGDHGGKFGEEVVGELLRRALYQALAELRELAADLGLDVIGQQRAAGLLGELDCGGALGKA